MLLRDASYRMLELVCRQQAARSAPEARRELEAMAREYRILAEWLENINDSKRAN